jgi:hypothetical protein
MTGHPGQGHAAGSSMAGHPGRGGAAGSSLIGQSGRTRAASVTLTGYPGRGRAAGSSTSGYKSWKDFAVFRRKTQFCPAGTVGFHRDHRKAQAAEKVLA